jgi:leucyl-tRNA synthetase
MVLKGGEAMSKSKGNIVSCDEMLSKYGADTIRLFELAAALPIKDLEFSETGIDGVHKFLLKLYALLTEKRKTKGIKQIEDYMLNETELLIETVTAELEALRFNLAITAIYSFVDKLAKYISFISSRRLKKISSVLTLLISPFTPHLAEELWHAQGNKSFVVSAAWPKAKRVNKKALEAGSIIEKITEDIKNILKIVKKKPSKVYLYVVPKETEFVSRIKEVISVLLGVKVIVYANNSPKRYDPQNKAGKARPGKPAIYIE